MIGQTTSNRIAFVRDRLVLLKLVSLRARPLELIKDQSLVSSNDAKLVHQGLGPSTLGSSCNLGGIIIVINRIIDTEQMDLFALNLLDRAKVIALYNIDNVVAQESNHGASWQVHDLGNLATPPLTSIIEWIKVRLAADLASTAHGDLLFKWEYISFLVSESYNIVMSVHCNNPLLLYFDRGCPLVDRILKHVFNIVD